MLKRFFISMLGTMAGIWISTALVIFGGLMLIGSALSNLNFNSEVKTVDKHSILYFDLTGEIQERNNVESFMQLIQTIDSKTLTLEDMLLSLRSAAENDNIDGLYLNCDGAYIGAASRQELIQEINNFKLSGKWVVAYGDSYSESDYVIASTADSLFLNPIGMVDIHGLGGKTPFFKGTLDKLGVKMQVLKVGTFKSAVEPFVLTSMSEPARLQLQQYVDSIWSDMAVTMATNRNIPLDSIYAWAPRIIAADKANTFVEKGLVTSLKYRRQVEAYLRDLTGLDENDELNLVQPSEYLANINEFDYPSTKEHVAVYYACGDIVDTGDEGIVGPAVVNDIVSLADDDNVSGLVLRVNSPGGSAFASEQIWESLQYFKSKGKPLYVSMGDYAASGGYYISCGADSIFADACTITGSIGVFGLIPDLSGLLTDKFGITFSTVETNANGASASITGPLSEQQRIAMQKGVEDIYDLFTGRVAEGRHMSQDSVKAIAEGRVWIASRAKEIGLVDRIGSLDQTVAVMLDNLGMSTDQVVRYPDGEDDVWQQILKTYGGLDGLKASGLDRETLEALHCIRQLRDMNPMQARMATFRIE